MILAYKNKITRIIKIGRTDMKHLSLIFQFCRYFFHLTFYLSFSISTSMLSSIPIPSVSIVISAYFS